MGDETEKGEDPTGSGKRSACQAKRQELAKQAEATREMVRPARGVDVIVGECTHRVGKQRPLPAKRLRLHSQLNEREGLRRVEPK